MAEISQQPDALLKQPSATIYLDGLMILCYDKHQKRLQAGIHTQAHFHALTIKVREKGQTTDLQSLVLEHEQIKVIAPLFLYVENKGGLGEPNGTATLYKSDDPGYRQAFANVIDLQSAALHKHDHLKIKPAILAPLNILNGEFYSATLGQATRMNLDDGSNPFNLGLVSTRTAGDISNTSGNLILRSKDPKAAPIIWLPLSDGKQYEVYILNEPDNAGMPENGQQLPLNHFNVYYEALVLKDGATKYTLEVDDPGSTPQNPGAIIPHVLPDDPPCELVQASGISQLPNWN